MSIVNRRTIN